MDYVITQLTCRCFVETQNVANHPMKTWTNQVPALCKQTIKIATVIFHPVWTHRYRERHVCWISLNTKVIEPFAQQWIVGTVKHHVTGIHCNLTTRFTESDRVRMPA